MCYGICKFENWHGECIRKPSDGPCPESFETEDEYWDYMERHPWNEAVEDWDDNGRQYQ